jgi:hypothetical protein
METLYQTAVFIFIPLYKGSSCEASDARSLGGGPTEQKIKYFKMFRIIIKNQSFKAFLVQTCKYCTYFYRR